MPAVLERKITPGVSPEKQQARDGLYDALVMASPDPMMLPDSQKIGRDLARITASSKKTLIGDHVKSSFVASVQSERMTHVHQIASHTEPLRELRDHMDEMSGQPVNTLTAIAESMDYLIARGQIDPTALEKAKTLFSAFGEAFSMYMPDIADRESTIRELEDKAEENIKALSVNPIFSFGPRVSEVVDHAGVHGRKGLPIQTIHPRETNLLYIDGTERNGATSTIEVMTPDGKPLTYGVTLVTKGEDGWKPVHVAPPISSDAFDPQKHIDVQQSMTWTTDLDPEEAPFAIVVESSGWSLDGRREHVGRTVHASLQEEHDIDSGESNASRLIRSLVRNGTRLQSLFTTEGLPDGEVKINSLEARSVIIRMGLEKAVDTDALEIPFDQLAVGRDTVPRLGVSFTVRVGVPGNTDTVPTSIMIDRYRTKGSELFVSTRKTDERDPKQKTIKQTDGETADRDAITALLGENDQREIIYFDKIETQTQVGDRMGATINTNASTRTLAIQPISRPEAKQHNGAQTKIEVVPLLTSKKVTVEAVEELPTTTFGDLLRTAEARMTTKGPKPPEVRITSQALVDALALEKMAEEERQRIQAESMRRLSYSFGDGFGSSGPMLRAFGGYTGASLNLGASMNRGNAEIGSASVVGQLPKVEVALVTTIPEDPPARIKDKRRKALVI